MKKRIQQVAVFLVAVCLLCAGVPHAQALSVSASHAILMDAASGRVLYEKDADARSLIASTTKIMTALVVCRQCNVLSRVEIMPEAVGIEGSSMYLREGEVLTVQELLYGMMLHSGNDAATALAIYCGGTVEDFAELMNDEARRIGLENTHFENPSGLDSPDHYSTARDLAKLTAEAMSNPIFAKTVGTKSLTVGERSLTNHNKLLWRYGRRGRGQNRLYQGRRADSGVQRPAGRTQTDLRHHPRARMTGMITAGCWITASASSSRRF